MMTAPDQARPAPPRAAGRGDRGSESVELAALLPLIVVFLLLIAASARVMLAVNRMSGVAGAAARDASIARSPSAAQTIAQTSATQALARHDLHCTNIRVDVDTSGFSAAPAADPVVRVDVWCTVDLSDISVRINGLAGSKTLHDQATSPLDPARDLSLGTAGTGWRSPRSGYGTPT